MGILDEAIREHLELKRRRGADPAEIERAEQEALGPVRRGPEEPEEPPEGEADEYGDEYESEPDRDVEYVDEPAEHDEEKAAEQDSELSSEDEETVEYEVQRDPEVEGPSESEDMLEETPDFLQETPEHDRLWFEQRPPRDFDFDD